MTKRKYDLNIIIPILIFFMVSILSIKSASIYTSKSLGNLVFKQVTWYIIGILLVLIILKLKNKTLYKISNILYVIENIILLYLLIFGKEINGSKCWLVIPGIGNIQPSEFMKINLMLTLSIIIDKYHKNNNHTLKDEFILLIKTLLVTLIPSILTFLEPDTGSVIMYLIIYFSMILTSNINPKWFIALSISFISIIGSIIYLYFFKQKLFINIFHTQMFYRLDRLFNWKNGSGMQLENALSSIGSSGVFGYGFKKTPLYFPESSTDFIFAVFSSNFGFIISIVLILTILYFDIYIINLAKRTNNYKNKFMLIGISSCLIFQHIQNIGMTLGLLPITGITLPFISYGGSSLLSYMIMLGIIINITREKNLKFLN
ncbi:MAG: FtsW/RodA/SpoVE family cell cycle protein [Bacilli bacterium]|nr:FtsW/RodA/SpoVE family cell cycle protein [Bacilli bacterium]